MKLAIVDNNTGFRKRLAAVLGAIEGIDSIREAWDVPGAMGMIRKAKPEVIILDLHMPGGSGLDVLRFVKSLPSPPVVIVLTIGPRSEYQGPCMAAGADYYVEKSSELKKVSIVLRSLVKVQSMETVPSHGISHGGLS